MDPSKMMPKMNATGPVQAGVMWHGVSAPSQTHGAVSVVTTVYPGVPSQSYNSSVGHGTAGGPAMFSGPGHGPHPSPYIDHHGQMAKQSSYGHDSMPYGAQHLQHHPRYPSQDTMAGLASSTPRHAVAVNAAAQAAAAAVATATATATAVAIDQSQFQNYPQDIQYGNQNYHASSVGLPPSAQQHSAASQMMNQQRPPMPSPYLPATRPSLGGPHRFPGAAMVRPSDQFYQQPYNPGQTMAPSSMISQRPVQQHYMVSGYGGRMPGAYHPQQLPANEVRGQHYPVTMAMSAPGGQYGQVMTPAPVQANYGQHAEGGTTNYQHVQQGNNSVYGGPIAALPNNPTPPLTPATPSAAAANGNYAIGNGAMGPGQGEGEPRVTLPLKNGIILPPFRLEHNSPVSQHTFALDDRMYQMLMSSPQTDLQLKCFHAEDKSMSNNWPHNANIQICVNGSPVALKSVDRPLYLKSLCQKQQNTLQVAVRQCCCSHLFCLTVVNRPTIESVVREITRLRSIPTEQCVERIKRFFDSGEAAQMRGSNGPDGNSDIEQMSITMSLKCPITMKRIKLPARGKDCKHPQCFDLWAYFEMNRDRSNWHCPICRRSAGIESLEIDQYVLLILTKLNGMDVDEVAVDSSAVWKPVMRPRTSSQSNENAGGGVKEEDSGAACGSAKRFKPDPDAAYSAPPSAGNFQAAVYNRSDSGLSPFYQPNTSNSPANGPPFGPAPVGPIPAMSNFGSPPASVQTRKPSRAQGPAQGDTGDPFSQRMQSQNGCVAYGGANTGNPIQSPASGGSSFAPSNVAMTATSHKNQEASTANTIVSDFPDFTFDDSDLLGSGSTNQAGGSLFNDPEELMKYLADPGDYSGFGIPTADQQLRRSTNEDTPPGSFDNFSVKSAPGTRLAESNASSNVTYSASAASSELASMEDILSLFNK